LHVDGLCKVVAVFRSVELYPEKPAGARINQDGIAQNVRNPGVFPQRS
jgi:hypothetical protein